MELVPPWYNTHRYFSPKKFGQKSARYTQQNTVYEEIHYTHTKHTAM